MTEIRLWNTKTKAKEVFAPIDPDNVRMYVCGPTVYDRAHLGNARPVVVFDVLYRLLRHVYGRGERDLCPQHHGRGRQDQRDRAARPAEGAPGTLESSSPNARTRRSRWYHEDMDAIGALRPSIEPRATQHIGTMVAMIRDLIAKGHAYAAEGHVLFAVDSYAGYGALSGRSTEDMIAGARVEVAPFKRNPMDFVLWKPSTDDLPAGTAPGAGAAPAGTSNARPWRRRSWARASTSTAAASTSSSPTTRTRSPNPPAPTPKGEFARVWMHNEMLQVEGKKMSKSLGNFFTVRDLLDQGVPGEVIRFVMLSTHYRKPMDWTEKKREEAEGGAREGGAAPRARRAGGRSQHASCAERDELALGPLPQGRDATRWFP
jgi:cysteinyl-tRNA synthetase